MNLRLVSLLSVKKDEKCRVAEVRSVFTRQEVEKSTVSTGVPHLAEYLSGSVNAASLTNGTRRFCDVVRAHLSRYVDACAVINVLSKSTKKAI